jgi:hypothetical protein
MQGVGFLKLMRGDKTLALMGDPNAFTLASVIAFRAQRTSAFNIHGLKPGEALLGDCEAYGMSLRQYRTAKQKLAKWAIATFRATNKGTIGRLIDDEVYDIHRESSDHQRDNPVTSKRQAGDNYQEGKNARRQEPKGNARDERTGIENHRRGAPVYRRDYQAGHSAFGQTLQA